MDVKTHLDNVSFSYRRCPNLDESEGRDDDAIESDVPVRDVLDTCWNNVGISLGLHQHSLVE